MSDWIDTSERLPNQDEIVLGCVNQHGCEYVTQVRCSLTENSYYFWDDMRDELARVTHWMKMPSPPEQTS